MIPTIVILFVFFSAFVVTFRGGVAACFTCVLLPAVLLIYTVSPLELFKLPDVSTLAAVSYGTIAALLIQGGGGGLGLRLHVIDALVIGLSAISVVSGVAAGELWTGVNAIGNEFLGTLVPYFMARVTFGSREWRLRAAMVLTGLAVFIALIGLIEFRFFPLFYSRYILKPFGLTSVAYEAVLKRFGRFRAQSTFAHPIDLGNGGALVGCMILALAYTSGRTLRTPWVAVGVAAAITMTVVSISFTAIVAIGGVLGIFVLCRLTRFGGLALLPAATAMMIAYSLLTVHWVNTPMPARNYDDEAALDGSLNIRQFIVQSVWPYASTAGFFGWGKQVEARDMGLESIDNAYLLFVVTKGWTYLAGFITLLLATTIYGGRAVLRVHDPQARLPVAAGVAGLVGIMMGMYTVFFGFVYAQLFILLLGLTVSMCQQVVARTDERLEPLPPRRGGRLAPARTPPGRYATAAFR